VELSILIRMAMGMDKKITVLSIALCIFPNICFASNGNCDMNYKLLNNNSKKIFVTDPFGIEEAVKHGDRNKLILISKYNNQLAKNLSQLALDLIDGNYEKVEKEIKSGISYYSNKKFFNSNIVLYLYYNLSRVLLLEGDYKSWNYIKNTSIEDLKNKISNCSGIDNIKISGVDDLHINTDTKIPDKISIKSNIFPKNTSVSYLPSHGYAPIINVTISGKNGPAVLDTGVFLTVIPEKLQKKLHVHIIGSLDNFMTAGGRVINPKIGYLDNLDISGNFLTNVPVVLLKTDTVSIGNQALSKIYPFVLSKNEVSFLKIQYISKVINFNYAYSESGLERNIVFPLKIRHSEDLSILDTGLESSHVILYERNFNPDEIKKTLVSQIRSFSEKSRVSYYSDNLSFSISGSYFKGVAADFVLKKNYSSKNIIGGMLSEKSKLYINFEDNHIYFSE